MIEMSTLLDGVIARASERLGYSALRPNQNKAIKSFLEGKDVFVTLLLCNNVHSNDIPRTISHDFIPRPSVRDVIL